MKIFENLRKGEQNIVPFKYIWLMSEKGHVVNISQVVTDRDAEYNRLWPTDIQSITDRDGQRSTL